MDTVPEASLEQSTKRSELKVFLLLLVIVAPLIAVLFVASYGFVVWFWQLLSH